MSPEDEWWWDTVEDNPIDKEVGLMLARQREEEREANSLQSVLDFLFPWRALRRKKDQLAEATAPKQPVEQVSPVSIDNSELIARYERMLLTHPESAVYIQEQIDKLRWEEW